MMHDHMSHAADSMLSTGGLSLEGAGVALALFVAGLVGSFTHCAAMCGPFVLAQSAAKARSGAARSRLSRLAGAALLPYHLGRMTTYVLLGVAAASITGALMTLPELRWLAIFFLAAAGLAFLAYAMGGLPDAVKRRLPAFGLGARWAAAVSRVARPLFAAPTGWRGYVLGMALGFIPCVMLYAALAAAAASASPLGAVYAMAAFALGTAPGLFLTAFAGHAAARRWPRTVRGLSSLLMVANAAMIGFLALRWVA
jgi:sulfite exporter TauE/SafE